VLAVDHSGFLMLNIRCGFVCFGTAIADPTPLPGLEICPSSDMRVKVWCGCVCRYGERSGVEYEDVDSSRSFGTRRR